MRDTILISCVVVMAGLLSSSCRGPRGEDGRDGLSSLIDVTKVNTAVGVCLSGSAVLINSGLDLDSDLRLDSNEINRSEVVCEGANGQDGVDGEDGQDAPSNPWTVSSVVDPCGDDPGQVDEVLLFYENGEILAWYKNVGLVLLSPGGSYVTTDKQECRFKIDLDGNYSEL